MGLGLDDEYDTEPLPALGQWPATSASARSAAHADHEPMPPPGPSAFSARGQLWDELTRTPHAPAARARLVFALAAVILIAVVGSTAWLMLRPSDVPQRAADPTPTATQTGPAADAAGRLMRLLPAGYSPDSCAAATVPAHAAAKVQCARNSDPGGPSAASYTLVTEKAALPTVLDGLLRGSTIVTCPGNIQSPGPWRRNATPQQVSGTLVCSVRAGGRAAVTWSTDADLLVTDVEADRSDRPIDQLYQWWSAHS